MTELFVTYILGAVPEALFFSLFLILSKGIKEKKLLFTFLMYVEFVLLKMLISYDVWFQIAYTFMTLLLLKVLYKDKAEITDIFAFTAGSLLLILISAISYLVSMLIFDSYAVAYIVNRFFLFGVLYLLRNKLNSLYERFRKLWNRKPNQKVRSLTVRNVSVIIFNLMFCIINLGMIFAKFVMNIE